MFYKNLSGEVNRLIAYENRLLILKSMDDIKKMNTDHDLVCIHEGKNKRHKLDKFDVYKLLNRVKEFPAVCPVNNICIDYDMVLFDFEPTDDEMYLVNDMIIYNGILEISRSLGYPPMFLSKVRMHEDIGNLIIEATKHLMEGEI